MKKIINSENVQYQPVLTEELVLDDKATVGSFNGITSDAVARAVAGASGEVPEVTSSDNGKVLTAVYDAGGPAVEWAEAQGGVPASTVADSGKVLTVDAEGTPAWATAGGGGGGSSSSAFDTRFELVNDGDTWRLSNDSSVYINLTGGAGVYAYRVVAEIADIENQTVIDDLYNVTVRVGTYESLDTKAIGLLSDTVGYISFKTNGILNISSAQHVRGTNVHVFIKPAKTSGTAVTSFTGGSVNLYLAKLSTLSGGWQPES